MRKECEICIHLSVCKDELENNETELCPYYEIEKPIEENSSECQMQTLVRQCREHLDWLDNELFEWSKNPEQYVIEDEQDLKSRRAELLQIFKECKIPRNA